jgi:hypothetical protein
MFKSRNIWAQISVSACVLLLPPLAVAAAIFVMHPVADGNATASRAPDAPVGKPFRFTLASVRQEAPGQDAIVQDRSAAEPAAQEQISAPQIVVPQVSTPQVGRDFVAKDKARLTAPESTGAAAPARPAAPVRAASPAETPDIVGTIAPAEAREPAPARVAALPPETVARVEPEAEPAPSSARRSFHGRHHTYRGTAHSPARLVQRNGNPQQQSWLRSLLDRIGGQGGQQRPAKKG